ncbi:MAG: ROK family protein [Planctomycetes bacterium]|nr:ROK family protein [Planctomycetota bacterium]
MSGWYLGIEIGGTKLQIAIGHGSGEPCRAFWRGAIDASQRAERIQQQIIAGVDELLKQSGLERNQIVGVGIGFGGPVDTQAGRVVTSNQVAGWGSFPLVEWISTQFGWPAILHNDADTAAYAEAHFGAGRGFDPVMYVTVGSGIGGGLIEHGQIFRGSGAGALEIGHLRPGPRPFRVNVPGRTVESIASGFGMEYRCRQAIAEALATHPASASSKTPVRIERLLQLAEGDVQRITARMIGQAAAQGDPLSQDLLADSTSTLGWALAQAISLINPARIVIGGGVSLLGETLFFEPVRAACRAEVFEPFANIAAIVPAALGEEVVIHGALALARECFRR